MASTTLVLKEENLVVLENVEKSVYEELQHKAEMKTAHVL